MKKHKSRTSEAQNEAWEGPREDQEGPKVAQEGPRAPKRTKKDQNRNLWEMEREARFNSGYHFGPFRQEKEKRKEKGNEESQQQPGPPYNQNAVDV